MTDSSLQAAGVIGLVLLGGIGGFCIVLLSSSIRDLMYGRKTEPCSNCKQEEHDDTDL